MLVSASMVVLVLVLVLVLALVSVGAADRAVVGCRAYVSRTNRGCPPATLPPSKLSPTAFRI